MFERLAQQIFESDGLLLTLFELGGQDGGDRRQIRAVEPVDGRVVAVSDLREMEDALAGATGGRRRWGTSR